MSGYIGTQPVPQATQTRDAFTATAGQTSFATSGYTPSFLDVFLNGVKLSAADYTASNGSDVVLASGAATGDILEVVAYTTFEVVTDTLTNAGTVLNLDRTGSDGTILDLKKDSSSVGSIGSESGSGFDAMYVANGDTGLIFQGYANDAIIPFTAASLDKRDAAIDLGYSAGRFKDLYLSGGVYLGGTGSANKLDDYEEGYHQTSFTPSGGGSITLSGAHRYLRYTKIGNHVYISGKVDVSSVSSPSGYIRVSLPFAVDNTSPAGINDSRRFAGTVWVTNASINMTEFTLYGIEGESSVRIYRSDTTTNASTSAQTFSGNEGVAFNFFYATTA